MSQPLVCEVCVVGGGPAGATIAARLARLGHDVLLVSAPVVCRYPRAQSLSFGILPTLEMLGLRQRMETAGLLQPVTSLMRWGTIGQSEPAEIGVRNFLIDRNQVDSLFLDYATEAGVRFVRGTVEPPTLESCPWQLRAYLPEGPECIEARFVVDASGRAGWLRKARTWHCAVGALHRQTVATLALHAIWTVLAQSQPIMYLEAGFDCWYWSAPLPNGLVSAFVFLDPKCQAQAPITVYHTRIAQSKWLQSTLANGRAERVTAYSASSYFYPEIAGENWIAVGESSLCVDPLSSQGVQIALATASQGATVVHTILSRPENTAIALEFYRDRQHEAAIRHSDTAARFYREQAAVCDSEFWRVRASPPSLESPAFISIGWDSWHTETTVQLSKDARLTKIPCLQGDLIVSEMALQHPCLDRPIAFIDGIEIAPLLNQILPNASVPMLVRRWMPLVSAAQGLKIACWLVKNQILVPTE